MKVISVTTPSGSKAYLEVDDDAVHEIRPALPPGGGTTASTAKKAATMIQEIEKMSDVIAVVCKTVQARVKNELKAACPTELTLEFGVKLAGEAGIPMITKGTVEGSFNVTATWDLSK
jgi:hypothetical protein